MNHPHSSNLRHNCPWSTSQRGATDDLATHRNCLLGDARRLFQAFHTLQESETTVAPWGSTLFGERVDHAVLFSCSVSHCSQRRLLMCPYTAQGTVSRKRWRWCRSESGRGPSPHARRGIVPESGRFLCWLLFCVPRAEISVRPR